MHDYKQARWIDGEGTLQGHPAQLRKNVSLAEVTKAEFPHVIIVNLAYAAADDDGLPAEAEELDRLDTTEEAIADEMQEAFGALFGLIATAGGTRDLFFFFPTQPGEDDIQEAIEACEPAVDYDFSIHHDPEWQPYVRLLP